MKRSVSSLQILFSAFFTVLALQAELLDNFDDNAKTDWSDFTFVPGVGLPVEQNGQFKFEIPGAVLVQAKQGLFTASQKTSKTIELKDGRRFDLELGGQSNLGASFAEVTQNGEPWIFEMSPMLYQLVQAFLAIRPDSQ